MEDLIAADVLTVCGDLLIGKCQMLDYNKLLIFGVCKKVCEHTVLVWCSLVGVIVVLGNKTFLLNGPYLVVLVH